MIKELGSRLQLNLKDDTFSMFETPEKLIAGIATCSKILKFKKERNEEPIIVREKEVTVNDILWRIVDFIMNVPSDYYRVIHPRRFDPYSSWRKKEISEEIAAASPRQKVKPREFEIAVIIFLITVFTFYQLFNFYILNLQEDS